MTLGVMGTDLSQPVTLSVEGVSFLVDPSTAARSARSRWFFHAKSATPYRFFTRGGVRSMQSLVSLVLHPLPLIRGQRVLFLNEDQRDYRRSNLEVRYGSIVYRPDTARNRFRLQYCYRYNDKYNKCAWAMPHYRAALDAQALLAPVVQRAYIEGWSWRALKNEIDRTLGTIRPRNRESGASDDEDYCDG